MRIEVHIDRLVLTGLGLDARHAGRVREAVEAELRRLLASSPAGVWSVATSTDRLVTGPVSPGRPVDPDALGRQVARALHAGLAPPPPTTRVRPEPSTGDHHDHLADRNTSGEAGPAADRSTSGRAAPATDPGGDGPVGRPPGGNAPGGTRPVDTRSGSTRSGGTRPVNDGSGGAAGGLR